MWKRTLHLCFSLILVSSVTNLSAQTCVISAGPPNAEVNATGSNCTVMYTIAAATAANPAGGTCNTYITEINGVIVNPPIAAGTTITLDVGSNILMYGVGPDENTIEDTAIFFVTGFPAATGIACNDGIQVSLGDGCQAIITPDMVLEGNYCYSAYTVEVTNADGTVSSHDASLGGAVLSAPGQYSVTVTDPAGNSCWSTITAEDKALPPVSCCDEMVLPCYQSNFAPLASITDIASAAIASGSVAAGDTIPVPLNFGTMSLDDLIMDLDFELDITTNDPGSIKIAIEYQSPGAMTPDTTLILDMTGAAGCTSPNINIVLDDSAFDSHSSLVLAECGQCANDAYCGEYQSFNGGLSSFNNDTISGTWNLLVINTSTFAAATVDGQASIEEATRQICRPEIEKFDPAGNLITPVWVSTGTNEFLISFPGNACSDVVATYQDVALAFECTDDYLSGFTREWTFSTTSNFSVTTSCEQLFYLDRFSLLDVQFPPNFDGIEMPTIDCSDFYNPSNTSDILDPVTGIVGYPDLGVGPLCSNFNVSVNDITLATCGTSFKLIRKYLVTDWCTGDILEQNQIIKVEDNFIAATAPVDLQIVGTDNQHDCTTDIFVDPLGQGPNGYGFQFQAVIENCSDYEVTVGYLEADPGTGQPLQGSLYGPAISLGNGEWLIPDILVGMVWVRYSVEDECGNTADSFFEIVVVDESPPNAVCLEHTIAALGQNGCAKVRAESFDNGSFDNCGTVDFRARIMNSGANYTDKVEFCCNQGYTCGSVEMVEFVVFDADLGDIDISSNFSNVPDGVQYSVCMVEIEFQDKIAPEFLNGPSGVTLACDVVIESAADLANFIDMTTFEVSDNCSNVSQTMNNVTFPISANECGGGSRGLSWRVEDGCGNSDSYSVSIVFETANAVSQVTFPFNDAKITINGCPEFGPDNPITPEEVRAFAGSGVTFPTPVDQACNSTAATFEDTYFEEVNDDGTCMKIVRKWTLIDWCTYDESIGAGVFTESQIIAFVDNNDPVINPQGPVNCTTDVLYNSDENECAPFVKIILSATDDCEELTWDVTVTDCEGMFGTQRFSTSDISGFYVHGEIEVNATVTDRCGNSTTSIFTMKIPDCKPPTPYCRGEVVTVTLPDNLTTAIWANDFELGSFDDYAAINNCPSCPLAGVDPLEFYFLDENGNYVPSLELTCADIPNGQEVVIILDVWVVDPNGAPGFDADFCTVELILQDNVSDICPDVDGGEGEGSSRVAGNVHLYDNRTINQSVVTISSNQPEFPMSFTTGTDGDYLFTNLPNGNSYQIETGKTTAVLNGVSTLDILLIQRHLLSLTTFNNPYQYIAADANNSEYVSAADMVTIRNVILEKTSEFTNGQESWRFVDASSSFNDPTSPFPYDEQIAFGLNNNLYNQDFIAVKIGDVSNDASAAFDGTSITEVRGVPLRLSIPSTQYTAGEEVRLQVTSDNFEDILGMQFTLGNDASLTFDRFEAGLINMSDDYVGYNSADEGKITVSWNSTAAITADLDDVLFTAVYTAITNGSTDQITIDNSITSDEAYDKNLNVLDIDLLNGKGKTVAEGYSLFQNNPNPFSETSTIAFSLPTSQEATLTIYDMSGRLLETFSGVYAKGVTEITVDSGTLQNESGVFYYQLSTNEFTATKKMILTN